MTLKIKQVLDKRPGNVQLFPLCEEDWPKRQVLVHQDGQTVEVAGGNDAE